MTRRMRPTLVPMTSLGILSRTFSQLEPITSSYAGRLTEYGGPPGLSPSRGKASVIRYPPGLTSSFIFFPQSGLKAGGIAQKKLLYTCVNFSAFHSICFQVLRIVVDEVKLLLGIVGEEITGDEGKIQFILLSERGRVGVSVFRSRE